MRYDQGDRLVFSQDGVQRARGEWNFFLYDALNRSVVEGQCTSPDLTLLTNTPVAATYTVTGPYGGYQLPASFASSYRLLKVNYYDSYRFAKDKAGLQPITATGYDAAYPDNSAPSGQGLLTGTLIFQTDDSSKSSFYSFYYDTKNRMVQSHAMNHLGGLEDEYINTPLRGRLHRRSTCIRPTARSLIAKSTPALTIKWIACSRFVIS